MADVLRLATARIRQLSCRNTGITLKQLVECSLKTDVARRIDAVGEVKSDRPNGSFVPYAEADGVNHIIEVLEIALSHAERETAEIPEDVSCIVKEYAVDVVAEQGEPKFDGIEE